jgi:hypothetical protein
MLYERRRSMRQVVRTAISLLATGSTVAAIGCGGSMSGNMNPTTAATPQTSAQVKIGDAPANRVISFEVTIGSMSLTPATGSAVTVLAGSQRVELAHLSATSEPLSALKVPQGTYSSASFNVSSPEITFIDNTGTVQEFESSLSQTITVSFNPALTIGASSSIVDIDLNIANSLTFDALGNVTATNLSASSFSFAVATVAAEDKQGHDDGELEDTTGVITSVNGSSFTLTVNETGAPLSFITDETPDWKRERS